MNPLREGSIVWYDEAVNRFYRARPGWKTGHTELAELILAQPRRGTCLEIGPGPGGATSQFLAAHCGRLDGLDIDPEARNNPHLHACYLYDGRRFPLPDDSYDLAVADYVLEHVERPAEFLAETFRVLKPGGRFCFRTPNLWHYVSLGARLTPHWIHERFSGWLRGMPSDAHAPYRTYHRANTRSAIRRLARATGFEMAELRLIEKEPSYGRASRVLFYLFLAYERIVNARKGFEGARANLLGSLSKPGLGVPRPVADRLWKEAA